MTPLTTEVKNRFSKNPIYARVQRFYWMRFGKFIRVKEIEEVWKDWVQHHVVDQITKGRRVQLCTLSTIEVVEETKNYGQAVMFAKGLNLSSKSKQVFRMRKKGNFRQDKLCRIVYTNTAAARAYRFEAIQPIKTAVSDAYVKRENSFREV